MRTTNLTRAAGALLALAPVALSSRPAPAQDTVAPTRQVLALDVTRIRPFARTYDMLVYTGDSSQVIGQRDVALSEATYAGQPAWLLTERRTGIVPALDSLFLTPDLRPVHWSSELGASRLAAQFTSDSMYGAVITPAARRSMILATPPDLLVSIAMVEALVPLLPLSPEWSDSVAVIALDAGEAIVLPAELAVVGEEAAAAGDSTGGKWLLTLRTDRGQMQLWVERMSGQVSRVEQALPGHVGSRLEFRLRATAPVAVSPP